VIENVKPGVPETRNEAAETDPVMDGSVTPPVDDLLPSGFNITVPRATTARLPKSIGVVFEIDIGASIGAIGWSDSPDDKILNRIGRNKNLFICADSD
jgi:hypothetical protein